MKAALTSQFGLSSGQVIDKLAECHTKSLAARNRRLRPATDENILTALNGLTMAAFADAWWVFNNERYVEIATRNADFLLTALILDGKLRWAWQAGNTSYEVFLEDYACLILGLLELYQPDFNQRWLEEVTRLSGEMVERFSDPKGGFFDTPADAETRLLRPKDLQDNATPCGNTLAAEALLKMAAFSHKLEWRG